MRFIENVGNESRTVTMAKMKPGQVGRISPNQGYRGIVAKVGDADTAVVVSLDGQANFWFGGLDKNNILVDLFEPGTILEFETE